MTSLFPSQRAAEDFDSVVEGKASPAVADRYAELFATVETLRTQAEVLPRAEFATDLRSRLMTAAEAELVPATPVVRRPEPSRAHRRNRRIGTLAAGLVIVGGTAGMAAAAQGSLPGDALYDMHLIPDGSNPHVLWIGSNRSGLLRVDIRDGNIAEYQVNMMVTFILDD